MASKVVKGTIAAAGSPVRRQDHTCFLGTIERLSQSRSCFGNRDKLLRPTEVLGDAS
jgi:hypothetical protein